MHVCMDFLLVYFVSQCIHACIEPSLHGVNFFLEICLWSDLFLFLIKIFLRSAAHALTVDASSAHVCIMASNSQYTAPSVYLPRKKSQALSPSYAQSEDQLTISREFHDCWWLFRTLHVPRYGARHG